MIPSSLERLSAGAAMMGRREDRQGQFFYAFNLDAVVPPDHLVRKIDAGLDLGWVHKELRAAVPRLGQKRDFISAKAQAMLGWRPRPLEETVLDCARSLIATASLR